jgi:hypothetical protein
MGLVLQAGDILDFHGSGELEVAIRWADERPGDREVYANHVAIAVGPASIVEALWTVREHAYADVAGAVHEVWRHAGLSDAQRAALACAARAYVGRRYGLVKLAAHFGDCMLGKAAGREVYLLRRLARFDAYPICSWVVAWAYWKALGITFGCEPNAAAPHDIRAHMLCTPGWLCLAKVEAAA